MRGPNHLRAPISRSRAAKLHEAQERSKRLLEEAEVEQKVLEAALANYKSGEDPPAGAQGRMPPTMVKLMIQRVFVQLRGEFIEALEAIKGK